MAHMEKKLDSSKLKSGTHSMYSGEWGENIIKLLLEETFGNLFLIDNNISWSKKPSLCKLCIGIYQPEFSLIAKETPSIKKDKKNSEDINNSSQNEDILEKNVELNSDNSKKLKSKNEKCLDDNSNEKDVIEDAVTDTDDDSNDTINYEEEILR